MGLVYTPMEKVQMRLANVSISSTLGCVQNLRIMVGNISRLFQVHVATMLPVGLLLGRPFLTLFKCLTQDFEDGYQ
ncbi:hypothetical protein DACRYDRAFT_54426 [Dacryopinax primogenitus]|uniref:Uncharacterized protein n=1 Tax=Dacryopinax primogenitus (strain DJM 731) TaxID=1858805 RepID=M5FX28_DACPD|nr:uncharacterized protein DACRYDRAFT_54426 [Dacryopinax primogenitus]EJU00270.1 hypothetical protein DACRYDRAFT_54426 [Dacryopinax primogenitus]